jgi:hypothetical protein
LNSFITLMSGSRANFLILPSRRIPHADTGFARQQYRIQPSNLCGLKDRRGGSTATKLAREANLRFCPTPGDIG